MFNMTKIIATIGPASCSKSMIRRLISAGMDVARLNFSHGSHAEHEKIITAIHAVAKEMNKPISILCDLQGPKIRTGTLKHGKPVLLKKNNTIAITTRNITGTAAMIATTYKKLPRDVKKEDTILLDDGLIELRVLSKTTDAVTCSIITGGLLKEHKGINLPGVPVSAPSLTEKDKKDLLFCIARDIDYFALSFVRSARDIQSIKSILKKNNAPIPVIAKIEKPEAVHNCDAILHLADGIMVARGDLGVELKPEQVPIIQKHIIRKAIYANKPVITATQMLESMNTNPIPTRAEASDVANAIFDGTDAIMLSGETATGKYPVKAVQTMAKIADEAEHSSLIHYNMQYQKDPEDLIPHAVAQSSVNILHEVDAKALVVFSWSGRTPKLISKQRPSKPIYAFTPFKNIYNRMSLVWGVIPLLIDPYKDTKRLIAAGEEILLARRCIKRNDLIVILTGLARKSGSTNLIKLHRVGQED